MNPGSDPTPIVPAMKPTRQDPLPGGYLRNIGRNLVIRDGVIATRDGSPLADYLASCGLTEGTPVNVLPHKGLVHLDTLASCAGIG